jgi:hypothetical protein
MVPAIPAWVRYYPFSLGNFADNAVHPEISIVPQHGW